MNKILLLTLLGLFVIGCAPELVSQPETTEKQFKRIEFKSMTEEVGDTLKMNNYLSFLQSNQYLMLLDRTIFSNEHGKYILDISNDEISVIGINPTIVESYLQELNKE